VWTAGQGRIPYISWKPKTSSGVAIPWATIASGAVDPAIAARADAIKAWGKPVYLTFHHEPENDTTVFGSPSDYIAAFRHVVDVFRARGVTNVAWAWTMMGWSFQDGSAAAFYPGDAYVDFVGVDAYNWYPGRTSSQWRSFSYVVSPGRTFAESHGKPIIVSEYGCQEDPDVAGRKAQWFLDEVSTLKSWPDVKAVLYYDSYKIYPWVTDSTTSALQAYTQIGRDPYLNPSASSPTPSASPTVSSSPATSPSPSVTSTPSPSPTPAPTGTPAPSPSPSPSPTASPTPSPTATASPSPSSTSTAGPTESASPTASPTASESPSSTPAPSPSTSPSPTSTDSSSPTPSPNPSPTPGHGRGSGHGPRPKPKSVSCTTVGTARSDRLVGTRHGDVICGLGGRDVIVGLGGNDLIVGGTGADRLKGGGGNDWIWGGTGKDLCRQGHGNGRSIGCRPPRSLAFAARLARVAVRAALASAGH
jgi:RTX calcium-binding nonapeptide repeat (4 copies)/Glycosyl hydrolase family 26